MPILYNKSSIITIACINKFFDIIRQKTGQVFPLLFDIIINRLWRTLNEYLSRNGHRGTYSARESTNGSVAYKVYWEEDEDESDTWAITEVLMKRVDAICELMHIANIEKINRRLEEIQQNRAMSEFQRLRVTVSAVEVPSESASPT